MASKTGQKRTAVLLSLLTGLALLLILSAAPAFAESPDYSEAYESGRGVHQDPAVFEKNFILTPAQKQVAIARCLGSLDWLNDDMSDLEKYYMLALWANYSVKYDNDFWPGGYDFDYYKHQWDAYGVMDEHLGVCAGIAVTYANLCHAAGLPCKFVRCDKYLDHTINHIPDINGHSYYIDVTENSFFMSQYSDWSFEPIDLAFSGIPEGDRPSDGSFEYRENSKDDSRIPAGIKDFYTGKTGGDPFVSVPFKKWYDEYALHKNTKKIFYAEYEEKGSGKGRSETGHRHASYLNFDKYPAQPYESRKNGITDIWFLNDFYQEPVTIMDMIERKVFDEQLLIVDALKENYDCPTKGKTEEEVAAALKEAIKGDITSVGYFPSFDEEVGKVVAETTPLTEGTDYALSVKYDDAAHEATITIEGRGAYSDSCKYKVKVNTALAAKAPIRNKGLQYDGSVKYLLDSNNPGEAINGTMVYAIGTREGPTEEFSPEIPTATNAGKYFIWYKVIGDENHFDSEQQRILQPAEIAPLETHILEENRIIRVGDKVKLTPALDQDLEATFSFDSSDKKIAAVSAGGTVTGVAEGSAKITIGASLKDKTPNYEEPYEAMITVTVIPKEAPKPDAATYRNASGDGNVWYRGSRATCDFVFKRSADDASTIDHFTGISVDGKRVDEAHYIKESGSVVIKLKPTYLETLALGDHTLKAEFNDGSASARFTVAKKSGGGESQDGDGGETGTGDASNILLWIAVLAASILAGVLVRVLNRRRTE